MRQVAAWTLLLDLLLACGELRLAAVRGRLGYRFHHRRSGLVDVSLDGVLTALPDWGAGACDLPLFAELPQAWGLELKADERRWLAALPPVPADPLGPAARVLVAGQIGTSLAEHRRMLPRLHSELLAGGMWVKRTWPCCISAAYVLLDDGLHEALQRDDGEAAKNSAWMGAGNVVTALRTGLPLANAPGDSAHDAVGVTVIHCDGPGEPTTLSYDWRVVPSIDLPPRYECMIDRVGQAYASRFGLTEPLSAPSCDKPPALATTPLTPHAAR